jgi:tripartite-type tricarboxylate transporter receptor subunit TctC
MKSIDLVAACVFAILGIAGADAQTYPTRPITMIGPYAAGGPTDTIARIMAEGMRASLGQAVVVETVTGAAGSLGAARVARAAPDGYTISMGQWGSHVVTGAIYALPFDIFGDFEPIALITDIPYGIVARGGMPQPDLRSLIAWLKANPAQASVGTGGVGSPPQVGAIFFQNATGVRFQFVPYRGSGPAMQDLVAGQIDMMFDSPTNSLPQVREGRIKAYAIMAKERLAAAPEIPTVDEAGLPGFYFSVWHALWAPKGTPKDVVAKLNAAVVAALADPLTRKRLTDLGQEIMPRDRQTPEALRAFHKAEIDKWWPIIKAAGIKGE